MSECRDCGEVTQDGQELCLNCIVERIKERELQYN
jgi:RNA polymerase subunit RPABC4/transcription elongation factor Spt4